MPGPRGRARHRGLHGPRRIDRQRAIALAMISTGLLRVAAWALLLLCYFVGVAFAVALFKDIRFLSAISVVALLLTDWGQVAASLAQLTAGDAHHDAEEARMVIGADVQQLDADIARLAELHPGIEAERLASEIRARIVGGNGTA